MISTPNTFATFALLVLIGTIWTACGPQIDPELEGTWLGLEVEEDDFIIWTFEFDDGQIEVHAEDMEVYVGSYSANTAANPRWASFQVEDSHVSDWEGETVHAIYEVDGDEAVLAANAPGDRDRPEDFEPSAQTRVFVLVRLDAIDDDDDDGIGDDDDVVGDDDDTVGDDDDVVGDDDDVVGDDDDVVADDDDVSDDDDDSEEPLPETPGGVSFDISFLASGGEGPGTADVLLEWTLLDDTQNQNELCSYTYGFEAEFAAIGSGQGDDFHPAIDTVLSFTSGMEMSGNCPPDYDDYAGGSDPAEAFEWFIDPLAVISCDGIASSAALGATQFIDDLYNAGMTDGTMASWCEEFGPTAQSAWGLGPIEGLWVYPRSSAYGAGSHNINYLPAPNGDIGGEGDDSWAVMGTVFATTANGYEPDLGLEGEYVAVPIWVFSFSS